MSSSLCCACLHKCLTTPSTNIQPTTTITSPTDMAARSRSSMVSYSSSVSNTIGYNLTTPNGSPSYSTFKSLMENSLSSTRSFTCSTSFMSISSCSCTRVCESGNSSNNTQNIPVVFHASYITTIVVLLTIIFILGACLAYQRRITARIIKGMLTWMYSLNDDDDDDDDEC